MQNEIDFKKRGSFVLIYLDYAATSPVFPAVTDEVARCFQQIYANPSSLYDSAYRAKQILNESRAQIARSISAETDEIVFTSGGTESNNLAVIGAARASRRGKHLVIGCTEHASILEAAHMLEKEGFCLSLVPCDSSGRYDPERVAELLRPDTALVSIQLANNETGVIQPIARISAATRALRIPLHCDAVAAYTQIPVDVHAMKIDLLSAAAHKIGGPKGTGFLYVRNEIPIYPLFWGGQQERGIRPGTENVPGIAGFAKALSCAITPADSAPRDLLQTLLLASHPNARVNGAGAERLPGFLSITFPGISGEHLLARLAADGIYASARAACASGSKKPSHVLTAMGLSAAEADATLRLTTGFSSKLSDMEYVASAIDFVIRN